MWRQRARNVQTPFSIGNEPAKKVWLEYNSEIAKLRECIKMKNALLLKREEKIKNIVDKVKEYGYGNCGESAIIISDKLSKKGIKNKNILMYVTRGRNSGSNHLFTVIGLDKDAHINEPSTWGNNAVIVDGWKNFVLSVSDAMNEYEKFFGGRVKKGDDSSFAFEERII